MVMELIKVSLYDVKQTPPPPRFKRSMLINAERKLFSFHTVINQPDSKYTEKTHCEFLKCSCNK